MTIAPPREAPLRRVAAPPRRRNRRRTTALLLLAALVVATAALVGQQSWPRADAQDPARALTPAEAQRLAAMPQVNWTERRAGVHAVIGEPGQEIQATGFVDWQHPALYLAISAANGGADSLVQAVPGLVGTRSGSVEPEAASPGTNADDLHSTVEPPTDRWQIRQFGAQPLEPGDSTLDSEVIDALVVLLFSIASQHPAASGHLAETDSQWVGVDRIDDREVDVLIGPATLPTPAPAGPPGPDISPPQRSLAAMGGAVQFWLDRDARLHRLDALLAPDLPVRVEFDRSDDTVARVLDALGGATVDPRPVTTQEATLLAQLRQRNHASGGGQVWITLHSSEGLTRASGWLDWQGPAAYLTVQAPTSEDSGLLWAHAGGVATRFGQAAPAEGRDAELPPLPAPGTAAQWLPQAWEERGDDHGGFDLELLLNEALSLTGWQDDDAAAIQETAVWLRGEERNGEPVSVYELPRDIEEDVEPGQARMRYWVDDQSGVLHRLEIRTRAGTYAQLDILDGEVPELNVVTPRG